MKTEKKERAPKKFSFSPSRIAVAVIALSLCAVLILWDSGVIDLPFLVRRDRRDPITQETQTKEENKTEEIDWGKTAQNALDKIHSFDSVENAASFITSAPFDPETMSLLKQAISKGEYSTRFGFLIKENADSSLLFTVPDLKEISGFSDFELTHFRDRNQNAVFQKKGTEEFFRYDFESLSFVPSDFLPERDALGRPVALPSYYGASDETKTLIFENSLFGYEGTYLDGKRTRKLKIEPVFHKAFAYSEGFAVTADENGKITILGENGKPVFEHLSLILPEKEGIEALGYYYFQNGILRVQIAGYDAEGNLVSRRESAIDTAGKEITLPQGYEIASFSEGILLVKSSSLYGYLSAKGAWIASPVFSAAEPFFEGLARVENEHGKVGLIDQNGNFVIPCAFDEITSFSDGHALLYSQETGWILLSKVNGKFGSEEPASPQETIYTKITITRGPQNTFDYEPDEIIELPPVLSTPKRTTRPENTLAPKPEPEPKPDEPTTTTTTTATTTTAPKD